MKCALQVLYSTSRVQQYGQSGLSTIYSTGSTALGTRGSPYTLVMQTVRLAHSCLLLPTALQTPYTAGDSTSRRQLAPLQG